MVQAAVTVLFPLLVAYAAATDFLTMTIANRVSVLLVAGFAVLAPLVGFTAVEMAWSLGAALTVFLIGFACFAMGWMGGGDVKFGAAVALWLGWGHLLEYAVLFSFCGGLLTLGALIVSRWLDPLPALRVGFLARFPTERRVPYGIALAAAALLVYPTTPWLKVLV